MTAMSNTSTKVLIVEDEPVLARTVSAYVERAGMRSLTVSDGLSAVSSARDWSPDVMILDLGLPGVDGLEVCRQVRAFSDCYIIMVTARDDEVDVLVGLSVGADDYVTKPFSVRELIARIHVLQRRPRADQAPAAHHTVGALSLDLDAREARLNATLVDLTRTEFDILRVLASRPRMAFTRHQIINDVWGQDWVGDEHIVDVHVAHLRKKLSDDPARPRYVVTVRGIGYRMGDGA